MRILSLFTRSLFKSCYLQDILGDSEYTPLAYPARPIAFKTFPDPRLSASSHFRFLASSCATPNFPYLPFHGRRIKGYDLLADYLWPEQPVFPLHGDERQEAHGDADADSLPPAFMIFLGDFIYADVPFYFGDDVETYRRLYRRNYQSPSFRKVFERLCKSRVFDS